MLQKQARRDLARDGAVHGDAAGEEARRARPTTAAGGGAATSAAERAGAEGGARRPAGEADSRDDARSRPAATSSAWTSPTAASPTRCSTTSTGARTIRRRRPYDDTGWTFGELFNVQVVRVTDVKVLDAPVEKVTGDVHAPGGVTGTGRGLRRQPRRRPVAARRCATG